MAETKSKRTSKKVKVLGTKEYLDMNTGELVPMQVTSIEERDFDFSKVWMRSFLSSLDLVGNAKTKVAYWVIEHLDKENQLTYTYRQIADATGISPDTVTKTMVTLIEADFLRRKNQGCYIVNPEIVFKGTRNGRLNVLTEYQGAEQKQKPELAPEERLKVLMDTIQQLTVQATKLSEQIKRAKDEYDPLQVDILDTTEAKAS